MSCFETNFLDSNQIRSDQITVRCLSWSRHERGSHLAPGRLLGAAERQCKFCTMYQEPPVQPFLLIVFFSARRMSLIGEIIQHWRRLNACKTKPGVLHVAVDCINPDLHLLSWRGVPPRFRGYSRISASLLEVLDKVP